MHPLTTAERTAALLAAHERLMIIWAIVAGIAMLLAIITLIRSMPELTRFYRFVYHRTAVIDEMVRLDAQERPRRHRRQAQ